jgi:RimJ/RimL family protein N-acetyltransferase
MHSQINTLGQPIGYPIEQFSPPPLPNFSRLEGAAVKVTPIQLSDLPHLYQAFLLDSKGANWTYLPYGPFTTEEEFCKWAEATCFTHDPKFYTLTTSKGPAGVASYLRIDPQVGNIEIGHIHLSPLLQRIRAGTEALVLMIKWAFESGYRRLEWKCDALNTPSRRAAERLGLTYEGTFRQATIYKSRNRDTAWYACTSEDWPALKVAYAQWLRSDNFNAEGQEIQKLSILTKKILRTPS